MVKLRGSEGEKSERQGGEEREKEREKERVGLSWSVLRFRVYGRSLSHGINLICLGRARFV